MIQKAREIRIALLEDRLADTQRELDLLKAEAAAVPEEPTAVWMTIVVRYEPHGKQYRYLILYVPGKGYYTTAKEDDANFFPTWERMYHYFYGPDVYANTGFVQMSLGPRLTPLKFP